MEQSSCTDDRIQHVLERCLSHLDSNAAEKQLWKAGLCISRWCLEELVRRDPRNFLVVLQKILRKAEEVLRQSQLELVVPLTLLFSSFLIRVPHIPPECCLLQEAHQLFHRFLSWPEPCSSASKHLLTIIQRELRAPGVSFQRLFRSEQALPHDHPHYRTILVLLLSPDQDIPAEVQQASDQLTNTRHSARDITTMLIMHGFQAVLGAKRNLQSLHSALKEKQPEELEEILKDVTGCMDTAACAGDFRRTRDSLIQSMERVRGSLSTTPLTADRTAEGDLETFGLPSPRCYTHSWESNNFDFLKDILFSDPHLDSPVEFFLKVAMEEDDHIETSMDEEDDLDLSRAESQCHRISTASSSSRDSTFSSLSLSSSWSAPSGSSGVESDFSEDPTPEEVEQRAATKTRKKPKKKSKSLLGIERFALLFKTPRSCRQHADGFGVCADVNKDLQSKGQQLKHSGTRPLLLSGVASESPGLQRNLCIRRRPILSCSEDSLSEVPTLVKVVVFGGDREAGRLARAYSDLQLKESKCPLLTKMCRLQFYFVPTKRSVTCSTEGQTLTKLDSPVESDSGAGERDSADIAHILSAVDPWYDRNVFSLLSLSSDVLCQVAPKDDACSRNFESSERLPLLADLLLYYCRNAEQPVLMQLYQAELTLAGGERRREVFIHSLELGHTAGTRAVKSMGAAGKRFGIDEEREAVPLTLNVAYNKVVLSGRSQWIQAKMVCTSINLHKICRESEQLVSKENLNMTVTEVLKRHPPKPKKNHNQRIAVAEVKVDSMQVIAENDETTFTVCLDQDEKKFYQSVTRCDVSLCCKPGAGSDWTSYKPLPGQLRPLDPTYCSLLCLPITSFSGSHP